MKNYFLVFMTSILSLAVGCGPQTETQSETQGTVSKRFNDEVKGKKEVYIYLANETSPDLTEVTNYALVSGLLEAIADPGIATDPALLIAKAMDRDLVEFPKTVDSEISALEQGLCNNADNDRIGLFLVSNRLLKAGKAHYCLPGKAVQTIDAASFLNTLLARPDVSNDFRYKSNPVSHPSSLDWALATASGLFAPSEFNYVLTSKSHGSRNAVVAPKTTIRGAVLYEKINLGANVDRLTEMASQEIQKLANNNGSISEATLRDDLTGRFKGVLKSELQQNFKSKLQVDLRSDLKVDLKVDLKMDLKVDLKVDLKMDLQSDFAFGKGTLLTDAEPKVDMSSAIRAAKSPAIGITEKNFQQSLHALGSKGVHFNLVFLEACNSWISSEGEASFRQEGSNISLVVASDADGLEYRTLDYPSTLAEVFKSGGTLASVLEGKLREKQGN